MQKPRSSRRCSYCVWFQRYFENPSFPTPHRNTLPSIHCFTLPKHSKPHLHHQEDIWRILIADPSFVIKLLITIRGIRNTRALMRCQLNPICFCRRKAPLLSVNDQNEMKTAFAANYAVARGKRGYFFRRNRGNEEHWKLSNGSPLRDSSPLRRTPKDTGRKQESSEWPWDPFYGRTLRDAKGASNFLRFDYSIPTAFTPALLLVPPPPSRKRVVDFVVRLVVSLTLTRALYSSNGNAARTFLPGRVSTACVAVTLELD